MYESFIYVEFFHELHEDLDGKTPSEACGITVKGKNKWKTHSKCTSKSKK